MHTIIFFPEEKIIIIKYVCLLPTLPKIFRPVTRNTLIFLFGLLIIGSDADKQHCIIFYYIHMFKQLLYRLIEAVRLYEHIIWFGEI